jgi:uncharacterized protein (DUF2252 family)
MPDDQPGIVAVDVADPDQQRIPHMPTGPRPSRAERVARGKAARREVPLESHALLAPTEFRPDPVELLERQAVTRVPDLVPIRYGRMLVSPFTFYRGGALLMASDLAGTPNSGLRAQLCGDAHMSNFGVFGSPERHLVFDANDFDETLPGPFEWDLKRLVTSLEIAGRENGFKTKQRRTMALAAASSYREAMRTFATQSNLTVWYAHLDIEKEMETIAPLLRPDRAKSTKAALAKARTKDSSQAFEKLATVVDGRPQIISDAPLIVRITDLLPEADAGELFEQLEDLLVAYRRTLPSDRSHLLEEYRLVDMARKVVGVGSVGTRAWILLMEGVDSGDPMFLQAKEAQASVLEEFTGASGYTNHGERVVAGQHLMQAVGDIFLGWERTRGIDGVERDYYIRQLRDWKGSAETGTMLPTGMTIYGRYCAWTLARAHARSGDRVAIAAYLGGKDTFDQAIADFATAYADLNDRDYAALQAAQGSGRIEVQSGL